MSDANKCTSADHAMQDGCRGYLFPVLPLMVMTPYPSPRLTSRPFNITLTSLLGGEDTDLLLILKDLKEYLNFRLHVIKRL